MVDQITPILMPKWGLSMKEGTLAAWHVEEGTEISPGDEIMDVETLRALEDALVDFAGCAVVISHDRFFLDRICTHILAFEGEAHVEWFQGAFSDYEEDKKSRLGADALEPKRMKHKKFVR